MLDINAIKNKNFWLGYMSSSYPNGYDEKTDLTVADLFVDQCTKEVICWWNEFTGYYDGIFKESDGYSENPTTLKVLLDKNETLTIEFHPGETVYFINEKEVGCVGPHWKLQTLSYSKVEKLLENENGEALFFLMLPLACVREKELPAAKSKIRALLLHYVPEKLCDSLMECIISGLKEE